MAKMESAKALIINPEPQQGLPDSGSKYLLEWSAPLRPFKPLNKDNFKRLIIWSIVVGLVLIFFKEFILTLTIFALLFFSYVMGTVPPQMVKHLISSNGVSSAGHTYLWRELRDFYFTQRLGMTILVVETAVRPQRLNLVLQDVERSKVENVLSGYLPHREETPKKLFDNLTEKAAQLLNLA